MAQKEKEETEFKVPDSILLCINGCGFSGNPTTKNMCQKCFQAAGFHSPPSCSATHMLVRTPEPEKPAAVTRVEPAVGPAPVRHINRCWSCGKKVGFTGFRCRCGDLFCSEHRYSDRHACGFDYKAAGREAIARENPVVKAAKIVRF